MTSRPEAIRAAVLEDRPQLQHGDCDALAGSERPRRGSEQAVRRQSEGNAKAVRMQSRQ